MEFLMDKADVVKAYDFVKMSLPRKTLRPILKSVYISTSDGLVTFRTTDGISDSTAIFPADVKTEGTVCLSGDVMRLINYFSEGEVKFKQKDGKIVISQKSRKHSPPYMDPAEYPHPIKLNYEKIESIEEYLVFFRVATSIRTIQGNDVLECFHINPVLEMVCSADSFRSSVYKNVKFPGQITNVKSGYFLPALSFMNGLGGKVLYEGSFENWVGLSATVYNDGDEFVCSYETKINTITGEFPPQAYEIVNNLNEKNPKVVIKCNKTDLMNVLEISSVYSQLAYGEGKNYSVKLSAIDGKILLSMAVKDIAEMEEKLTGDLETDGEFHILFNPTMLLDDVKRAVGETITLQFYDPKVPFVLKDEDPNYTYVQVPIAV